MHCRYLCNKAENHQLFYAFVLTFCGVILEIYCTMCHLCKITICLDSSPLLLCKHLPLVCDKFVQHQAAGIYYIPWPAKNWSSKALFKSVCQSFNNTVQPQLPTSQSCQKINWKNKCNIPCVSRIVAFIAKKSKL